MSKNQFEAGPIMSKEEFKAELITKASQGPDAQEPNPKQTPAALGKLAEAMARMTENLQRLSKVLAPILRPEEQSIQPEAEQPVPLSAFCEVAAAIDCHARKIDCLCDFMENLTDRVEA